MSGTICIRILHFCGYKFPDGLHAICAHFGLYIFTCRRHVNSRIIILRRNWRADCKFKKWVETVKKCIIRVLYEYLLHAYGVRVLIITTYAVRFILIFRAVVGADKVDIRLNYIVIVYF